MDPAELFSKAPTEKKEANPKLNMVKFLQVGFRGRHSNCFSQDTDGYCDLYSQLKVSVSCLVSLVLLRLKPEGVTMWFYGWTAIKKARTSVLR